MMSKNRNISFNPIFQNQDLRTIITLLEVLWTDWPLKVYILTGILEGGQCYALQAYMEILQVQFQTTTKKRISVSHVFWFPNADKSCLDYTVVY